MMVGWNQYMGEIEKLGYEGFNPPSFAQATIIYIIIMNVDNLAEVPNQTGDDPHVLYDLLKSVYIFSNCCRSPTVALGSGAFSKWWDESYQSLPFLES